MVATTSIWFGMAVLTPDEVLEVGASLREWNKDPGQPAGEYQMGWLLMAWLRDLATKDPGAWT